MFVNKKIEFIVNIFILMYKILYKFKNNDVGEYNICIWVCLIFKGVLVEI